MNKPKEWWGKPSNAKEWIRQNKKRTLSGDSKLNTTVQSTKIVLKEINENISKFHSILEVGAGDGRLIGELSKKHSLNKSFYSIDINKSLSAYVKKNYKSVSTFVGNITKLPFKDDSFDLVYTYQVLQHVHPEDIQAALSELKRVAKKEVWMWEGIGRVDGYVNGAMTHSAHDGSWVWHINTMLDCYEVSVPQNENIKLDRQRLYKYAKKKS